MNFCSNCGSDNIELTIPEGDNRYRYVCPDCKMVFYKNPRIITGVLCTWEDKVLLGKRAIEPRKHLWNLPAGFMECEETLKEGAARELLEETEASVKSLSPFVLYSLPHVNQVYIIFKGIMKTSHFKKTTESEEVSLFSKEDIPWGEIAFSSSEYALKRWVEDPNSDKTYIGFYKKENNE